MNGGSMEPADRPSGWNPQQAASGNGALSDISAPGNSTSKLAQLDHELSLNTWTGTGSALDGTSAPAQNVKGASAMRLSTDAENMPPNTLNLSYASSAGAGGAAGAAAAKSPSAAGYASVLAPATPDQVPLQGLMASASPKPVPGVPELSVTEQTASHGSTSHSSHLTIADVSYKPAVAMTKDDVPVPGSAAANTTAPAERAVSHMSYIPPKFESESAPPSAAAKGPTGVSKPALNSHPLDEPGIEPSAGSGAKLEYWDGACEAAPSFHNPTAAATAALPAQDNAQPTGGSAENYKDANASGSSAPKTAQQPSIAPELPTPAATAKPPSTGLDTNSSAGRGTAPAPTPAEWVISFDEHGRAHV